MLTLEVKQVDFLLAVLIVFLHIGLTDSGLFEPSGP